MRMRLGKLLKISVFAVTALWALPAGASPISASNVTSLTLGEGSGSVLTHIIDGSGLSSFTTAATHAIAEPFNSWVSANGTVGSVVFDLASSYDIDGMAVWNFNNENQFGVDTLNILGSLDGLTFSPIAGAPSSFAMGAFDAPETAQLFSFTTTARYIRFDIESSYGGADVGLSEVMFTGTPHVPVAPVPEPATLGLVGLGLAGALARRRARQAK